MPTTDHRSLTGSISQLFKRESLIAARNLQSLVNPLMFFSIVIILFPLGVSPDSEFLRTASVGLLWVSALLAMMLSLDNLFQRDFDNGTLEQLVMTGQPLYLLVLVKSIIHWLLTGLPLVLISPVFALMLNIAPSHLLILMLTLAIGTPVITLIGGIGAALTVSLRSGGVLVSLLVLPLTIPVLIFGSGTVQAYVEGLAISGHLAILCMLLVLSVTLAPFAIAAAIRLSVSN